MRVDAAEALWTFGLCSGGQLLKSVVLISKEINSLMKDDEEQKEKEKQRVEWSVISSTQINKESGWLSTYLDFLDFGHDSCSCRVHTGLGVFSERLCGAIQFIDRIHGALTTLRS